MDLFIDGVLNVLIFVFQGAPTLVDPSRTEKPFLPS